MELGRRDGREPGIGARVAFRKTLTVAEQAMFTGISGNLGPRYVDATQAGGMAAFELILAALASTCLARLAGPGHRIAALTLRFAAPVAVGETVEASAELLSRDSGAHDSGARDAGALRLRVAAVLDGGATVMTGEAEMLPVPAAG